MAICSMIMSATLSSIKEAYPAPLNFTKEQGQTVAYSEIRASDLLMAGWSAPSPT